MLAAMDIERMMANAKEASQLLKAMSNERRLLILCHLASGEKAVCELEALMGLSQSALSQHLAKLRQDDLVRTRRNAQSIYYSLHGEAARAIMVTLHGLYCIKAKGSPSPCPPRPAPSSKRARR